MSKAPFCAAIDWGTSTFRLWLIARDGGVIAERRSADGLQSIGRPEGFAGIMESHLAELQVADDLPVIICGMAGSRQGWIEARYLEVPAPLDGVIAAAVRVPDVGRDVRILPGIAQRSPERPDVMRGEETQLLGAAEGSRPDGLFCLPGTHSKWVAVRGGAVEGFATFMTGEMFDLLGRQSILAHAIEHMRVEADDPDFLAAVAIGSERPADIANNIFAIRPAQLLGFMPPGAGAARLSGVLIGTEIAGATARFGAAGRVSIVASGRLAALYAKALESRGAEVRLVDAEAAVRRGLHAAALALWS